MRKTLYVLLIPLLIACEFKAEKVKTEINKNCLSELYLITNVSRNKEERYRFLFALAKDSIPNLCDFDSSIMAYSVAFYNNTVGFKEYFNKGGKEVDSEYVIRLFEDNYLGGFYYRRDKDSSNVWYLTYPNSYNDTIYCE